MGSRSGAAIAQRAMLCRKMSLLGTTSYRTAPEGQILEGPASLGQKLENRGKGQFSKSTLVPKLCIRATVAGLDPTSTGQAGQRL
ncbi:hypothetical protein ALO61_200116 [Pseudomonas savastanoi pv. nerii]|nr:hypothetical protein ALO61_200116 [Pseudomonas savastanoi pv. nerii]